MRNPNSPSSTVRGPSKPSAAKLAADATPDEAAVKGYYEAHKSQYMTPETVNLRYVEVPWLARPEKFSAIERPVFTSNVLARLYALA